MGRLLDALKNVENKEADPASSKPDAKDAVDAERSAADEGSLATPSPQPPQPSSPSTPDHEPEKPGDDPPPASAIDAPKDSNSPETASDDSPRHEQSDGPSEPVEATENSIDQYKVTVQLSDPVLMDELKSPINCDSDHEKATDRGEEMGVPAAENELDRIKAEERVAPSAVPDISDKRSMPASTSPDRATGHSLAPPAEQDRDRDDPATGEAVPGVADEHTIDPDSSGPDLIDELKSTIQLELEREEDSTNEIVADVSMTMDDEVAPNTAEPVESSTLTGSSEHDVGHADVNMPTAAANDVGRLSVDPGLSPTDASTAVAAIEPASEFIELANNIEAQWGAKDAPALLIAPVEPLAEVSATVAQLGHALARRDAASVLVVGANEIAGSIPNPKRATTAAWDDVCTGKSDWHDIIRRTSIPGLKVLPGSLASMLVTRSGPTRMAELLSEFRREYRIVLIDGSSLGTTDLGLLADGCTGVYLVVRLQQTTAAAAKAALGRFKATNARVMGSIAVGATR